MEAAASLHQKQLKQYGTESALMGAADQKNPSS